MPKKYIPIPKDQQKKRGPKKPEIQDPENKLFADPFNEAQAPAVMEEKALEPVAEPLPEVKPEPVAEPVTEPEPVKPVNSFINNDVPTELDSIINDYSAGAPNVNTEPSSSDHVKDLHNEKPVQATQAPKISLVRGYMILLVLDFVLPMGITFLLKKTGNPKFKNLTAKDIKLSEDEFDDLEPVADEVAKDVQLNLSPMTQLFLGMSIIYGGKILTLEK